MRKEIKKFELKYEDRGSELLWYAMADKLIEIDSQRYIILYIYLFPIVRRLNLKRFRYLGFMIWCNENYLG